MSEVLQAGYKLTEVGVIPEDWSAKCVGDVCQIFGRIGFRGYTVNDIVRRGQGAIAISPSNIRNGKMNFADCTYISWLKYEESPEIKLCEGDILLVKTGSTFGKTAIIQKLHEKATLNPQLVVLKNIKTSNVFLSYMMGFSTIQKQIIEFVVGGALPTLSQRLVANFKIPVPNSDSEQRAIAAALSDIDALLAKLDTLIAKKRNIKQATMQQLLTGQTRLPGYQILSGTKQTELGVLPLDCSINFLKEIATVKGGKRLPLGTSVVDKVTPHPYLRVTDMLAGGIDLNDIKYVPDDVFLYIKNYRISIEDIFISVAGTLGIVGKIPTVLDGANLTENANKITSISCDRDFLLYNLMSDRIQGIIESAKTVGAQPKLAIARIEKFAIALPSSRAEQTAIAAALSDMDTELTALEARREKTREIKQGMMQELLTGRIRLL